MVATDTKPNTLFLPKNFRKTKRATAARLHSLQFDDENILIFEFLYCPSGNRIGFGLFVDAGILII